MLDFLATLLVWLGLPPMQQDKNYSLEDVSLNHEDESSNLLGIMDPDG